MVKKHIYSHPFCQLSMLNCFTKSWFPVNLKLRWLRVWPHLCLWIITMKFSEYSKPAYDFFPIKIDKQHIRENREKLTAACTPGSRPPRTLAACRGPPPAPGPRTCRRGSASRDRPPRRCPRAPPAPTACLHHAHGYNQWHYYHIHRCNIARYVRFTL